MSNIKKVLVDVSNTRWLNMIAELVIKNNILWYKEQYRLKNEYGIDPNAILSVSEL